MGSLRFLLDTATFLWSASLDEKLSGVARGIIRDPNNQLFLSIVSVWEIAIKVNSGKLSLPVPPEEWVKRELEAFSIVLLSFEIEHVFRIFDLPMHHRDPFDRLLAAQCIVERIPFLTSDKLMRKYPIEVIW